VHGYSYSTIRSHLEAAFLCKRAQIAMMCKPDNTNNHDCLWLRLFRPPKISQNESDKYHKPRQIPRLCPIRHSVSTAPKQSQVILRSLSATLNKRKVRSRPSLSRTFHRQCHKLADERGSTAIYMATAKHDERRAMKRNETPSNS